MKKERQEGRKEGNTRPCTFAISSRMALGITGLGGMTDEKLELRLGIANCTQRTRGGRRVSAGADFSCSSC